MGKLAAAAPNIRISDLGWRVRGLVLPGPGVGLLSGLGVSSCPRSLPSCQHTLTLRKLAYLHIIYVFDIYVYMYVCIYVCIYIYTIMFPYIHTTYIGSVCVCV